MRALILVGFLAFNSQSVLSNECDINIKSGLALEEGTLTIDTDAHQHIVITKANQLFVNDAKIELNPFQQQLVSDYYLGIYTATPQAVAIASDAITLASVTLDEVFSELLGSNNDTVTHLTLKFEEMREHLQSSFYTENGEIKLNSRQFEDGNIFNQDWQDEFSQLIEEVVSNSVGHLLLSMTTEVLWGDSDLSDFEHKIEKVGQGIDQRIELQSAELEARAESLCSSLMALDRVETKLQRSIDALSELNLMQMTPHNEAM